MGLLNTTHCSRRLPLLLLALLLPLLNACTDELGKKSYTFNAKMEALSTDAKSADTKVYLVNEEWTYWEEGDFINIASNNTPMTDAYLVNFGGEDFSDFNGVFACTLNENSEVFLGLHPVNENNQISSAGGKNFNVKINLASTQPVTSDITFARDVFPMVAWFGGDWPYNLDFHSLAGIVRVQLFSTDPAVKTLSRIEFSDLGGKQLVGLFDVANYKTFDPHLVAAANTAANRTLTLDFGGEGGQLDANILTFYVVLPAQQGMSDTTIYHLNMTVYNTDGETCTRSFKAAVRRNGITYLNALNISNWEKGTSTRGLVGNGTEARPFKIYTADDMVYLKDSCYNHANRRINNQPITENTWIRIMRSDIELTTSNWRTSGIQNFVGHMTYYASNSSRPGITNNSNLPIFQSVSATGTVDGLTVKVDHTSNSTSTFSPVCNVNRGTLKDCRLVSDPSATGVVGAGYSDLAGICVTNYGTLSGCGCLARMSASGHNVAGVCYTNTSGGIIKGCYAASTLNVMSAATAAGICYDNAGTVQDSYFAAHATTGSMSWGGIVYNNTGTILHSYLSNTATIGSTGGSVGGIVNTMTGGTVDYCWADAIVSGRVVGGIAASVSGGSVINCFLPTTLSMVSLIASTSEHIAGGLVAQLSGSGSISNSYVYTTYVEHNDNTGTVGGFVGKMTGGSVSNCYVYETSSDSRHFYGSRSGGTLSTCYVVNISSAQADVNTDLNPLSSALQDVGTGHFETLKTTLNTNRPSGGKAWERIDDKGLPILEEYRITGS